MLDIGKADWFIQVLAREKSIFWGNLNFQGVIEQVGNPVHASWEAFLLKLKLPPFL